MINVITLNRPERMDAFIAQAKVQGFSFTVWDGVQGDTPVRNINKAHKAVIREAKEAGRQSVRVAEDDLMLTCKTAYKHYVESMPEDYDVYFGGVSGGNVKLNDSTVSFFSGMFLYTVHERFYDAFLAADPDSNIDRWISNLGLKEITEILGRPPVYKICYPMVAITSNGWSDNFGCEMDYTKYFKQYELYKG